MFHLLSCIIVRRKRIMVHPLSSISVTGKRVFRSPVSSYVKGKMIFHPFPSTFERGKREDNVLMLPLNVCKSKENVSSLSSTL
jgi:hypothetical protein